MLVRSMTDRYNIDNLALIGTGGQGSVYQINTDLALKLFSEKEPKTFKKLRECIDKSAYCHVSKIAAVPQRLVFDQSNQEIGYIMKMVNTNYVNLSEIISLDYCLKQKITLRRIGLLFLSIHDALSSIHQAGFLIGDVYNTNIMFMPIVGQDKVSIIFLDVDSWGISTKYINHRCTAIHPKIMHREINDVSDYGLLKSRHDWYAFSHLLASCILKCDPFEKGSLSRYPSERRKYEGITCWDPKVYLTDQEIMYDFRIGNQLISVLVSWLSGIERGIFPRNSIENFIYGLRTCRKCNLEFHNTLNYCPRCNTRL